MAALYTQRFMSAVGDPLAASYTVPEGYRGVIRSIDAWYTAGDGGQNVYLQNTSTGAVIWRAIFGDDGHSLTWTGRQVVEELEELEAFSSGGLYASISVSGYLLTLP
jgi:hypothetical protein